MTVFVDSSVWFASIVARDSANTRAKAILLGAPNRVTTDHVVVETWLLLKNRYRRDAAEQFWDRIRRTAEIATAHLKFSAELRHPGSGLPLK